MKITIFTSNQPRHLSLIKKVSSICDSCFAVLETNTVFPGLKQDFFQKSEVMKSYFKNVQIAENKIFGHINFIDSKISTLSIKHGDLNNIDLNIFEKALDSDLFIVFGSSFIKGKLIDELLKRRSINIHMGLSPFYRGSSCNFWAAYEENFHLIGSTIHLLSKGLDSGDILYHALPTFKNCNNAFDFSMKSVLAAHESLISKIKDETIYNYIPIKQDKTLEKKYTRNSQFDDFHANEFLKRNITINHIKDILNKKRDDNFLIRPFFY